jgi:hypothetical protein
MSTVLDQRKLAPRKKLGGGLGSLVQDTSPQLGGDLDLNGHVIKGVTDQETVAATGANLAGAAPTTAAYTKVTLTANLQGVLIAGLIQQTIWNSHATYSLVVYPPDASHSIGAGNGVGITVAPLEILPITYFA